MAMFISTLIVTVVVSAFASAFRARESAGNTQRSIEDAKTSMEYMAKVIRMSSNLKPTTPGSSDYITMYNKSREICIKYEYGGNKIIEYSCSPEDSDVTDASRGPCYDDGTPCSSNRDYSNFTPKEITGSKALSGAGFSIGGDYIKRVTIQMQMASDSNAKLQTTVSTRDYKDLNPTGN